MIDVNTMNIYNVYSKRIFEMVILPSLRRNRSYFMLIDDIQRECVDEMNFPLYTTQKLAAAINSPYADIRYYYGFEDLSVFLDSLSDTESPIIIKTYFNNRTYYTIAGDKDYLESEKA